MLDDVDVLVVEDHAPDFQVLCDALATVGAAARLRRAGSGGEAVAACAEAKPDALVVDFGLPDGPGDALLARLKAQPPLRDVPAVMLTGVELRRDVAHAEAVLRKGRTWEEQLQVAKRLSDRLRVPARPAPTIVVVDDNPGDFALLEEATREVGFDARLRLLNGLTEFEAWMAQAEATGEVPDLALLDINLPRVDGHELIGRLQARPRLARVPVVMYSSSERPIDRDRGVSMGALGFVGKPATFEGYLPLVRALRDVIVWRRTGGDVQAGKAPSTG